MKIIRKYFEEKGLQMLISNQSDQDYLEDKTHNKITTNLFIHKHQQ